MAKPARERAERGMDHDLSGLAEHQRVVDHSDPRLDVVDRTTRRRAPRSARDEIGNPRPGVDGDAPVVELLDRPLQLVTELFRRLRMDDDVGAECPLQTLVGEFDRRSEELARRRRRQPGRGQHRSEELLPKTMMPVVLGIHVRDESSAVLDPDVEYPIGGFDGCHLPLRGTRIVRMTILHVVHHIGDLVDERGSGLPSIGQDEDL